MSEAEDEMQMLERLARELEPGESTKRGRAHLRARQAAASKKAISVRLDRDIVERLKALAGPGGSYQSLMNRALAQWCDAQEQGALLERRLERLEQLADKLEAALDTVQEGKEKSVA